MGLWLPFRIRVRYICRPDSQAQYDFKALMACLMPSQQLLMTDVN